MKTHTSIGYKICMNDLKLRPFAAGALYHHEALDGTGYPNKVSEKEIPYEAQIIRVADEFEAITAKRQYKSHVGVIDALNIIIDHARPSVPQDVQTGLKRLFTHNVGKVDKNVVKALFKVIIDDTEYEIVARSSYVEFVEDEIKRITEAQRYYLKMESALTESKREYYKAEVKCFLKPHEEPERIPEMLEEFKNTYKARQDHILKLYHEVKQIKKLTI